MLLQFQLYLIKNMNLFMNFLFLEALVKIMKEMYEFILKIHYSIA